MTKLKFLTLLVCFSFQFSFGQNFSIQGTVSDANQQPIELGNIILLSIKDSSIIKGDVFLSGQFKISGISENKILLKITSLGFEDYFQSINKNETDTLIDIGVVQLKTNTNLKEVEVVSKLPLFERDGERVKVNVENSVLSNAGTILDVLKKSPTVMIDNNDNVAVFGKGNAIIYLDGQLIASADILKTISSTEIKEIEIISNPSAKYDASGKAVINIITKKNNLEGYNGNLIHNTLYGKNLFTYSGLRFNYKRKKWSTFISYGFPHGKDWSSD